MLLTNDYVWGHTTSKATKAQVEADGGKIVDELLVPQNTRDFTSYLLKMQQIKPDVVATAVGGDDIKALRQQVVQLKLDEQAGLDQQPAGLARRLGLRPTASSACSAPPGTTGSTCRASRSSSKRSRRPTRTAPIPVPGNVSYNGYMATRELLRAIERAGTTNNIEVIKELEGLKMSAADRMQHFDAYIDPVTHQMQQTIYLARRNDQAGGQDRHLRDPQLDRAEGRADDDARRPSASS